MFNGIIGALIKIFQYACVILELVNIVMTPFSANAFWGLTWSQVIHAVFVFAFLAYMVGNEIIKAKRPYLLIKPMVVNQCAFFEVKNNGGIGKFRAVAIINKGYRGLLGYTLAISWEPGGQEIEIGNGGTGKLLIAHQEPITINPFTVGVTIPVITNDGIKKPIASIWELGEMGEIRADKIPDDVELEISITADRDMKRKISGQSFRISQNTITDLRFDYIGGEKRKLKPNKAGYLR